jgi:endoglucanase
MWKLRDPINNTAFDIHEYLDVDFSGSHVDCVSDPRIFLSNLTSWLEDHNFKAMITEFGGSNTTGCYDMLKVLIDYMEESSVYIGWSMWAAGMYKIAFLYTRFLGCNPSVLTTVSLPSNRPALGITICLL